MSSAPPYAAHAAHIVVSSALPVVAMEVDCCVTKASSIDPVEDRIGRPPLRERVVLDSFRVESGKTSG